MKKIKYLILMIVLIIPFKVYALGVEFTCPVEVKSGEEFTCTIYGPSVCAEITMDLNLPNGFTYKSDTAGKNYTSLSNGTSLSYKGNGTSSRVLSVINIKAPSVNTDTKYQIELQNIKYKYTSNDTEYTTEKDITKSISIKSNSTTTTTTAKKVNNMVATLNPNGGDGDEQSLSCTLTNNYCDINLDSATVPIKEGYTFKGWGTSKDCVSGQTGTYSISTNITLYACFEKLNTEEIIPYLDTLTIEGYPIEFSKFKLEYEINISEDITALEINATPANENSTIDIVKPDELVMGENTILINVKNGNNTQTYTINVIKGESDNSTVDGLLLSNVVVSGHEIVFDPNVYTYDISLNENEKELIFDITLLDENSSYEIIGNENLKNGSTVVIRVSSGENYNDYIFYITANNSFISNYLKYIIAIAVVVFMFVVYFIVRSSKNKKSKEKTINKEKSGKKEKKVKENKKAKEKKTKNKKVKVGSAPDTVPPIETL
jgi:large-conductance mechanosensitive channel